MKLLHLVGAFTFGVLAAFMLFFALGRIGSGSALSLSFVVALIPFFAPNLEKTLAVSFALGIATGDYLFARILIDALNGSGGVL